jgi:hypothetical protein
MLNRVVDLESRSRPVKQWLSFELGSLLGLLPSGPTRSALTICALQAAFSLSTADAASRECWRRLTAPPPADDGLDIPDFLDRTKERAAP